jgi:predicted Zn-dependent protease
MGGYGARQAMGMALPTMFMKFSRGAESEADYLGTQYMYAAGYDPNGAISIFEKLESLRRTKPGFFERVLSTHPMDADRINKTQAEIEHILPARSEYIVSTSEYRNMRERLIARQADQKAKDKDARPRLRVAPGAGKPEQQDTEDRPTVRRRDGVE